MEIEINNLQDKDHSNNERLNDETLSIPVIQENVVIDKIRVETGKVRVVKKINEENHVVDIPLVHEEIDIKTVPVNQYVDTLPEPVRYEGDTMIIPVIKEVYVLRILVEKEIHITKKRIHTVDSRTVSLRKEEITIENTRFADDQHPPQ